MEVEGNAVTVRKAYKRYGSSVVLRGLDLNVGNATIYGLLGPSGCGKTTLLRTIVGLLRLDSGEITVKAGKKNNVGYMPQDLGLYEYMGIMEAFQFYGKLYSMEREKVKRHGKDLMKFLQLPDCGRPIGTLSTGQQRRVSFAVALIHDPDLLILDEPTVGIDPILSAAIWERLEDMVSRQKKTVILTTHYIEEARKAHMIGLMRGGVLLAEQSPTSMMVSQCCDSLEKAFLVLSLRQETAQEIQTDALTEETFPNTSQQFKSPLSDSCSLWNTNRFTAQLTKNVRWLCNNITQTAFILMLPVVITTLVHYAWNSSPIANRAVGIVSEELTAGLDTCTSQQYAGCSGSGRPLTCRLMDYLTNSSIVTVVYDDLEQAKKAALKNEIWGFLYFTSEYTSSIVKRLDFNIRSTDNKTIDSSFVNVYLDMSSMWVSSFLRTELIEDVRNMIQGILQDCGINPKVIDIPIQKMPAVFGSNNPSFLEFVFPGVACSYAFGLAILYTVAAILYEKGVGLERSVAAGMTKLELVAAHCVVHLLIGFIQELATIVIFYGIFGNPYRGNIYLAFLLLMLLQIKGNFFALVIGLYHRTEFGAVSTGVGSVLLMLMTSGLIWPVEGMHDILRSVVWAFPVQPAVESYRAILARDWDFTHPVVFKGFLSTSIWTMFFILGTIVLARNNKTTL